MEERWEWEYIQEMLRMELPFRENETADKGGKRIK
jgi:hypothetical protein